MTALLVAISALGPISTDLYLPSLPAIGRHFASSAAEIQLTLSVFLFGFAVSQLIYGPLADRFGRRPVLIGALLLYFAASLLCWIAPGLEVLIAARFLQAIGACAGPVVARAVVRDVYGASGAARILSHLATAVALAPAIGPVMGGFVENAFGWRSNLALLALWGAAALAATWRLLPETIPARNPAATQPQRIAGNYLRLAADSGYCTYVAISACAYGGIFAFISGSSFVLIEGLGLSPAAYGFCFAVMPLGYMSGAFLSVRFSGRREIGRLILAGAAVAAAAGIGGFALALILPAEPLAVVAPIYFFGLGAGLMIPNAVAGAIGPFPTMAGAASALLGFLQMGSAALIGIAVGQLVDATARGLYGAVALVGLLALVMAWSVRRRGASD
ncbi:MAG: multidrug effflux MFS transporter [Kiloniellales bacterium]